MNYEIQREYKNFSEESEQCVLGTIFFMPERFVDLVEIISEDDFFVYRNKVIFRAMAAVDAKRIPIDIVTVIQALTDSGDIENAGGLPYLAEIAHNTGTSRNIIAYANILKEKSAERAVVGIANAMIKEITEGEAESKERVNNALAMPMTIETNEINERETVHILKESILNLEIRHNAKGAITGLKTQYSALDERFNGLQKGQLMILAARPSMGKSTLALNLAANFVFDPLPGAVVFFSLEMTGVELTDKMICAIGNVDYKQYRLGFPADVPGNDAHWSNVSFAITKLKTATNFVIDDRPSMTLQQIRAKCIRLKRKHGGMKCVIIDYLTLIKTPGRGNRTEEIGAISRGLKALAKEIGTPVIALAQLSRKCEDRSDRRPILSDLRDSGEIEQDADIVSFIYRDEVYNENSQHVGIAEIITAKNRAGEIGKDFLQSDLKHSKFNNLSFVPQPIQPEKKKGF